MRVIVTEKTVYKFNELTEDQKEKAIEKLSDINADYGWWGLCYNDAEEIGLKITGFDIDRGYCEGELIDSMNEVCNKILANHGESSETYKTAQKYLSEYRGIKEDQDQDEDLLEDIEDRFTVEICEDYLAMLWQEYEFQTSKEAIIETIEANDYEFDENGNLA